MNRDRVKARLGAHIRKVGGFAKVAKRVGRAESTVRQWTLRGAKYPLPSISMLAALRRRTGLDLNNLFA